MTPDELERQQRRIKALMVMIEFILVHRCEGVSRAELRQILRLDGVNLDGMLSAMWRGGVYVCEADELLFIDKDKGGCL